MIMLGAQAFKFDEKGFMALPEKKWEFLHYNVSYAIGDRGILGKMHGTEGIKLCGRYLIRSLMICWFCETRPKFQNASDKDWKRQD